MYVVFLCVFFYIFQLWTDKKQEVVTRRQSYGRETQDPPSPTSTKQNPVKLRP